MHAQGLSELVDRKRRDDPHDLFGWTLVSTQHKYVWVIICKNACVTTTVTLRELEGNPFRPDGDLWGDEGVLKLRDFATDEIVEMLTSPDWFRFCFVRNPYERLLSAYKSKIGNGDGDPYYQTVKARIREFCGYSQRDGERVRIIPFRDFFRFVRDASPYDLHWCVQSQLMAREMISYDFVGRYENFQEDFKVVLERFHASPEVMALAQMIRGQSAKTHLPIAYDDAFADEVYRFYEEDFRVFGYSRDSWMYQ